MNDKFVIMPSFPGDIIFVLLQERFIQRFIRRTNQISPSNSGNNLYYPCGQCTPSKKITKMAAIVVYLGSGFLKERLLYFLNKLLVKQVKSFCILLD